MVVEQLDSGAADVERQVEARQRRAAAVEAVKGAVDGVRRQQVRRRPPHRFTKEGGR